MNYVLIPLLASLTQATSLILHKLGLSKREIRESHYIPLLFLFLTLYGLSTFPFLGWIDLNAITSPKSLAHITLIIIFASAWNLLYFRAIKTEGVNLIENIISLSPITTIAIAWIFLPHSFDLRLAAAGLTATLAMIWGYWHKHKLGLSANALLLILSVIFMSIENILIGIFLAQNTISPAVLFTLRVFIMLIFFLFYYKPFSHPFKKTDIEYVSLIALISTAMMIFKFYALRDSGIIFTSLILILVPFIVFLSSVFILHEKIRTKQIITIIVVLLCVLYATLLQ
jgi:drug/metabolite transporter (DMT)-like permease